MADNITSPFALEASHGLPDKILSEDGEVRVLDLSLAEALGFANPIDIRKLIRRYEEPLSSLGIIATVAINQDGRRGRPGKAFYLNHAQALFIVAKSETKAADIELAFIAKVFTEYQRGNLIATDADTQARLEAAEAERKAKHQENMSARKDALKLVNRGRVRKKLPWQSGGRQTAAMRRTDDDDRRR